MAPQGNRYPSPWSCKVTMSPSVAKGTLLRDQVQDLEMWRFCWVVCFGDEEVSMSQGTQAASESWKSEENKIFLRRLQKEVRLARSLLLAHLRLLIPSVILNLVCFEPPSS